MADIVIALVFTVVIASVLCLNEGKIQSWANSKHGHRLEWRE